MCEKNNIIAFRNYNIDFPNSIEQAIKVITTSNNSSLIAFNSFNNFLFIFIYSSSFKIKK